MKQIGIAGRVFLLKIGCNTEEREKEQPLTIDITVNLKTHQKGCFTDNLEDVYCNTRMLECLESFKGKEFNLIEYFAFELKKKLINELNIKEEDEVSVRVYKHAYQSFCVV